MYILRHRKISFVLKIHVLPASPAAISPLMLLESQEPPGVQRCARRVCRTSVRHTFGRTTYPPLPLHVPALFWRGAITQSDAGAALQATQRIDLSSCRQPGWGS